MADDDERDDETGRITTEAEFDSEGRLVPFSGHTEEGFPIFEGPPNQEGHRTPVDYQNAEGQTLSSSDETDVE